MHSEWRPPPVRMWLSVIGAFTLRAPIIRIDCFLAIERYFYAFFGSSLQINAVQQNPEKHSSD